ncbi:carboxyl-terminal protease [Maribacter algarum]|uniref:Carboxyl-terminal protease n=1 Tax=Maribacter algarum (ex Zhang et al. 2020) TaxID=2578118 RepID=A0A5S3PHF6_9FLAO|nr:S41 family peptidase [Maribacter algarum]TMM53677.1 carboxyl-terminal protease [Maribacter algarum]
MKYLKISTLLLCFIAFSCSKNDDNAVANNPDSTPPATPTPVVKSVADYPVQDFMWKAMNTYYFWQSDVSDLADTKDDVTSDYVDFLSKESNPADFFFKLCNQHIDIVGEAAAIDRFSFLRENYKDLVNGFAGISKTNGVRFGTATYGPTNNDVFGFVRYIIPGSNADGKDIKRGDIFTAVNGIDLTLDNYIDLLGNSGSETYTLNFADLVDNTIVPNGRELSLTKESGTQRDPIFINKIIEQNGLKIGYFMYNQFISEYNEQLNEVFETFKAANIDELILDLRYNPGGATDSALQMASSIYSTDTSQLFAKDRTNSKLANTFWASSFYFVDETSNGTPINSLNLNRVYVITTGSTASASEFLINGLNPYMDVIQIGDATAGKNEFSFTLVDDAAYDFLYNPDRESNINPKNQWGIQPILGRAQNAAGFEDYTAGLIPDKPIIEDIANMGILGDPSERLLNFTLNEISATSSKTNFDAVFPANIINSTEEMEYPDGMMSLNGLINPKSISDNK